MLSIIVAFPKLEDAKNIKTVLVRNGLEVSATCTSGAQVISIANELDAGIVVSGYRFSDMYYLQLQNYLPDGFEMLLVASQTKIEEVTNGRIVCLSMPIKLNELLQTLQIMTVQYQRRRKRILEKQKDRSKLRSVEEIAMINKAKSLLMERNHMSEEEAHRYIQKTSMDSGTNMVETAEKLLTLLKTPI